jgi:hydroxymethylbilane synthase
MGDLLLATRGSALALAQARAVADELAIHHPGIDVELVVVTTSGDLDRTSPVTELTELGAFVRAVQHAVLVGDADAAVHSCKDLPVHGPEGLAAIHPARLPAEDVLCGAALTDLRQGARVGTGSPRRSAQLSLLRPDLEVTGIRGNVDTRLTRVGAGDYDAVVLAEAGLCRLGRLDAVGHRFPLDQMVPAPAQGALAVECPEGAPAFELLTPLDDPATRRAVVAERAVLGFTRMGCRGALGAHASPMPDGSLVLTGFVDDDAGPRRATVAVSDAEAPAALCEALGIPLEDPVLEPR